MEVPRRITPAELEVTYKKLTIKNHMDISKMSFLDLRIRPAELDTISSKNHADANGCLKDVLLA